MALCVGLGCQKTKAEVREPCVDDGCGALSADPSGPASPAEAETGGASDDSGASSGGASAESRSASPPSARRDPALPVGPTTRECEALLDHIAEITVRELDPESQSFAAQILAERRSEMRSDCLERGVRSEVLCATQAPDLDGVEACAEATLAEPPQRTPETTPTEGECDRFEAHVMGMLRAQGELADAEDTRETVRQQCDHFWTKAGVACALGARALSELNQCQNL